MLFFLNQSNFPEIFLKTNNNSLLSKSLLKYLVQYQVFWIKAGYLQEECISISVLLLYLQNNLPGKKTLDTYVTIQTKFFQICLLTKYKFFNMKK